MEDIESDLSAFHRVEPEDVDSLSSARFFSLAMRLMHYRGALRGRMENERENPSSALSNSPNERTDSPAPVSLPIPTEARPVVSGTEANGKTYYSDIKHNLELAQYFD